MNIKHAVITSVDRDDLKDGGFILDRNCKSDRRMNPNTTLETLISIFMERNLDRIVDANLR
jgi:lipoic acid synthetase